MKFDVSYSNFNNLKEVFSKKAFNVFIFKAQYSNVKYKEA
jgi:hypothetical protein